LPRRIALRSSGIAGVPCRRAARFLGGHGSDPRVVILDEDDELNERRRVGVRAERADRLSSDAPVGVAQCAQQRLSRDRIIGRE
jgi:hypothetical protein